MVDTTSQKPVSREEFEAELQKKKARLEERRKQLTQPNSGKPDNEPSPGSSGGSGSTPQENGGSGENVPPSQPEEPTDEYDQTMNFESNAYGLDKMAEEKREAAANHHSGGAKAPDHKKDGYKPGSSNDFLQACYNEIVVASYAGLIDFGVDLTLDIFDWILFAPLSSGKSAGKKENKKDKTVFDYADELIAENTERGKELVQSVLVHHKEIMDNIERVQNGQTPEWKAWQGKEPKCFKHLVEIKTKADADPNCPEAALWAEFKDLPRKAVASIANQVAVANFSVHHAALTSEMTDVTPLPIEVTKAFKDMEKVVEDPKLSDADVKSNLSEKVNKAQQHVTACMEITEKLYDFSDFIETKGFDKKKLSEKLANLETIRPVPEEVTKSFAKMKNILEDKNLKKDDAVSGLLKEIKKISPVITITSSMGAEITEKLNKFSELLLTPDCSREAMAQKVLSLEAIHPIKDKLKQDAAVISKKISKNIEAIDKAFASDPERAKAEKEKYLEKINKSQKEAAVKKHKDLNSIWLLRNFGIKNFGNTKGQARDAVQYAANTMRYANIPPNNTQGQNSGSNEQPKKRIENDTDVMNFINSLGLKR